MIDAGSANEALMAAKHRGVDKQTRYKNDQGEVARHRFLGVMELLRVDLLCEQDEVWYEVKIRTSPEARKRAFVPDEDSLDAIAEERTSSVPSRRLQPG